MRDIQAPKGYEACVSYCDGARSWTVALREVGDAWWKDIGCVGHAHSTPERVDELAASRINQYLVAHRLVAGDPRA